MSAVFEAPHRPIRVAVTYRVCQQWRAHIFARMNARPDLEVVVFHGRSVSGTKLVNGGQLEGFGHREQWTISRHGCAWVFHPLIWFDLARFRPDVILAEGGSNLFTNFIILAYSKAFRKPVIWWTLGELKGRPEGGFFRRLYRRAVVFQEKMVHTYLGYSVVALDYFRRMGYPESDCFVAVNCVDTDKVFVDIENRTSSVASLRKSLALEGARVILFVGAFSRQKRIDRLVRAFVPIAGRNSKAVLVLVGDGPVRLEIVELVKSCELENQVRFAGNVVEGISDYFELADLFVLPGLGGLAVSEAMAHGLPVICTFADGCEVDLVVNGETGFRLNCDDDVVVEKYLVEKMSLILDDEGRHRRMSQRSFERIRNVHNVATYVAGILEAIHHASLGKTSKIE